MRIYFEEYHYPASLVRDCIADGRITNLKEGKVKLSFVGYLYSAQIDDVVFVLPKVFVQAGKAFGEYAPEEMVNFDEKENSITKGNVKIGHFIFELSTWLYLSIKRYHEAMEKEGNVENTEVQNVLPSSGSKSKSSIEIVLELIRFAKKHRQLFAYQTIVNNLGTKKIRWAKTISKTQACVQEGVPYYLDFKTEQKERDWNEQLIVLFYSVMRYLNKTFHFKMAVDFNYELLSERKIEHLMKTGKGLRLLRTIRRNYFKSELVQLWKLLYTFFDWAAHIKSNRKKDEYLLVRVYNKVFEHMIDQLIGSQNVAKQLKQHKDGKQIDHIYKHPSLFPKREIYYIGDSKYYSEEGEIDEYSQFKQFTYAKNIIQYNIDLYNKGQTGHVDYVNYRDELTEGYNITPNFFIRGHVSEMERLKLAGAEERLKAVEGEDKVLCHFKNRLFDRDTLFTQSYQINFLFVLSFYVHHTTNEPLQRKIRDKFRTNFIKLIHTKYDIFLLTPKEGAKEAKDVIKQNFYCLIGKIFSIAKGGKQGEQWKKGEEGGKQGEEQNYFFLGLEREKDFEKENEEVKKVLDKDFTITAYRLGTDLPEGR